MSTATTSFNCTCFASFTDEAETSFEFYFDAYSDCSSMEDVKAMAIESYKTETGRAMSSRTSVTVEITDFDNISEKYANETDCWMFAEACAKSGYEMEVVEAALDCDVQPSDIDEAYSGQFSSDEDFAEDMAESIGAIDKNAKWPNNCIDWELAAREIMYDYSESNGYYFRNM